MAVTSYVSAASNSISARSHFSSSISTTSSKTFHTDSGRREQNGRLAISELNCEHINPFTADCVKALHFATLV